MDQKSKLILALIQVENISNLMRENVYGGFMTSHLLPLRYEFERQLVLLTNKNKQSKI